MTELKINPQQVTYLKIYGAHKGVKFSWGYEDYTYKPASYFKCLWLFKTPFKKYNSGYYRYGRTIFIEHMFPELEEGQYTLLNEVYTKAHVEIFAGKEIIKTIYFDGLEEARKWCETNLPNVNLEIP